MWRMTVLDGHTGISGIATCWIMPHHRLTCAGFVALAADTMARVDPVPLAGLPVAAPAVVALRLIVAGRVLLFPKRRFVVIVAAFVIIPVGIISIGIVSIRAIVRPAVIPVVVDIKVTKRD